MDHHGFEEEDSGRDPEEEQNPHLTKVEKELFDAEPRYGVAAPVQHGFKEDGNPDEQNFDQVVIDWDADRPEVSDHNGWFEEDWGRPHEEKKLHLNEFPKRLEKDTER